MKTLFALLATVLCLTGSAQAQDLNGLIKQLKDPDAEVRRLAAKSLGEVGPKAKEAVHALIQALKDSDQFVRRFSARALGAIGPEAKQAVPALSKALADEKKEVAEAAAEALGQLGPAAVSALNDALKDKKKDPVIRAKVADALGKLGANAKPAVPALIAALSDKDVRLEAVNALAGIGPDAKDAIPALTEINKSKEKDKVFRKAVTDALKKIDKKK